MNQYKSILICTFLALLSATVYWQVLGHEFIDLDDPIYVTENPQVLAGLTGKGIVWAFSTVYAVNWHPLTWLSHMVDVQIFGLNALGHHLTSLLFHVANSVLLFLVFSRMTGAIWQSGFVAALFAIHPLHVESVAWIAERKDVLSTFLGVLSLWMYLRYVEQPRLKFYLLALLFFALGLMGKPMLVTIPILFLLLDYWPLRRFVAIPSRASATAPAVLSEGDHLKWSVFRSLFNEKIPFFILSALSGVATFYAQQVGGAMSTFDLLPLDVRLSNAMVSYVIYIWKMFWPSDLAVFYPHPGRDLSTFQIFAATAVLLIITAFASSQLKRRPFLFVGWMWYLITLAPVIGIIQVGVQGWADRYSYIPSIGAFVMIAWGIPELFPKFRPRQLLLATLAGFALAVLSYLTFTQLRYWRDSVTLFERAINVDPDNWFAHHNLGLVLATAGRYPEAGDHFAETIRLRPRFAPARHYLAIVFEKQGKFDESVREFTEALELSSSSWRIHYDFGLALYRHGRMEAAISQYLEAIKLKPDYPQTQNNLATALFKLGRASEAIPYYTEAIRLKPEYPEAHYNLGVAWYTVGRIEEAIEHYTESLRQKPDYPQAHNDLGVALFHKGRVQEAISHYTEALRLRPDYERARNNLSMAEEAQKGKRSKP